MRGELLVPRIFVESRLCASAARAEFMMRSASDFSLGVYGVDGMNCMPRRARYCCTYLEVYSLALSVLIVWG